MNDWRFDVDNPANEFFEDDVMRFWPAVKPGLERALDEILDDPLGNLRDVVREQVVYIKRLAPVPRLDPRTGDFRGVLVPALLLAYTVNKRAKLIRKLLLYRVAEVAPQGSDTPDLEIYEALQRVLELALARAKSKKRRDH
jgi:hypothetical protein